VDVRAVDTWQRLDPEALDGRAAVVFDVLRATTTLAFALAGGARWVAVVPSVAAALDLRAADPELLLAGEVAMAPPPGFDLGNSPVQYTRERVAGRRLVLVTTNGTRALVRADGGVALFAAALVNAGAVARALLPYPAVLLVAAGSEGRPALEDLLGAGAVLHALTEHGVELAADRMATLALDLFRSFAPCLPEVLAATRHGQRLIRAGYAADVELAARLDSCPVVPTLVAREPLRLALSG
jgi:2-phosphosulfolactate phosphatase